MDNVDVADITEQARDVLANVLGMEPDNVPDAASTATLPAWDSLHHVTLIVALEERFNVMYTSEEIPRMVSLQDITRITAQRLAVDIAS